MLALDDAATRAPHDFSFRQRQRIAAIRLGTDDPQAIANELGMTFANYQRLCEDVFVRTMSALRRSF